MNPIYEQDPKNPSGVIQTNASVPINIIELQKQIATIKPTQVVAAAPTQVPRPLPAVAPGNGASQPYVPPGSAGDIYLTWFYNV